MPFATTRMHLEGEVSQTEKDKYCVLSFRLDSKNQSKHEYNKIETDWYGEQTSGYQWGEGWEEGQDRSRQLRSTNYYV